MGDQLAQTKIGSKFKPRIKKKSDQDDSHKVTVYRLCFFIKTVLL